MYDTERPSRKLDNKKWGPFKITELIGSSALESRCPDNGDEGRDRD